ncbi:MAG: hypothetical protein Ta2D_09000 [Rickettsiales bacterium]|nr:MAG: hypothetical protein Ta2D_09000 [Rickettsiales bacterium]
MEIEKAILMYFDAKNSQNISLLDECLSEDISIEDKGEDDTIEGLEKCKEWFKKTGEKYKLTTEIIGRSEVDDKIVILTSVSGDFEGSPCNFEYSFVIKNDKIKNIIIEYVG